MLRMFPHESSSYQFISRCLQLNGNTEPFKTAAIATVLLVLSSLFAFSYLFWKAGGFYRGTLGCNWKFANEEY